MVDFQESKTKENLARSFAAECQEGARYQFLSKMCLQQGYEYMSGLIRTLAHNEMSHAKQFFQKISEYGKEEVNNIDIHAGYPFKAGEIQGILVTERDNEKNSGENVYPTFAEIAREEGYDDVAELFNMVAEVELSHEKILNQLAERLAQKKLYKSDMEVAYKCDECGFVARGKTAPKVCPLCQMEQGYFRIDLTLDDYKDLEDCNCETTRKKNCKC